MKDFSQTVRLRVIRNHFLEPPFSHFAKIKFDPVVKYRINKQSIYDPTITHKRGMYSEDTITCEMALTPEEYLELREFLTGNISIYIEFTIGTNYMQFPVTFDKLPPMSDHARSYTDIYTFTFKSVYQTNNFINFAETEGYGSSYGSIYGFS